jgi:uncharacterized ParB-like nuclease family protein
MAEMLSLDVITTEGTQARVTLSTTVIHEYADALQQGDEFPPIDVYYDNTTYWLADGFHRLQAAKQAGRDTIAAIMHQGGQREALLHALGANDTHGHRRTDTDRRHAVELMLADPEWRAWNNSAIARQCRVSEFLVRTVRQELEPATETPGPPEQTRKVTRGGKTFTMRTGRIGTARASKRPPGASSSALGTQPLPPMRHTEQQEGSDAAPASSIESKIDSPPASPLYVHEEETPAGPIVSPQTEDEIAGEPIIPQPQPSLMDAWQHASDDEREAFVARYRDELRRLLAAHDEPQPTKRARASQQRSRSQPQQTQRRRPAANKRS